MISDWLELATYWKSCGLYQDKANELNKLIPISGNCSDSKLELYRVMSNAYYDIYNNKACNNHRFYELEKQIVEHYDEIRELTDFSNIESTKLFDWINYAANNDGYSIDFNYDLSILRLIERLMNAIVIISYVSSYNTIVNKDLKQMKYLMKYNEYQEFTRTTAQYPKEDAFIYTQLGFIGEVGEVANKYKKVIRGDYELDDIKSELIKEVGDLIWYYARHMDELGYKLEPLLQHDNDNRYHLTYSKLLFTACLNNLIFNFISCDYETTGSELYLLACLLNTTLEEVMVINKAKLEDRLNRNVIKGTGDDR